MTSKIITEAYIENNYLSDGNQQNLRDIERINTIPWSQWFDIWLTALSESLPQASSYELSLRLTSDREITIFNNQYRQKNQPTDVLAFAALESELISSLDLTESLYLGDIIISLDTANKQAEEQHHSLVMEIAWLASHGLLHLLGWDHPDDSSLTKMLQQQANLLKLVEITERL
jgi:probable rRNA maturation factor